MKPFKLKDKPKKAFETRSNGVKTKKNLLEKAFLRLTFMVNAVSHVRY